MKIKIKKEDKLLESFNDFELLSKNEMSQIIGGGSSTWNQIYGNDTTGAVIDAGRWTIRIQTSSNDCDEYENEGGQG